MKKAVLFLVLLCATAAFGSAQQKSAATTKKSAAAPKAAPVRTAQVKTNLIEISDREWATLAAALDGEDWEKGAALAAGFINRFKTDNEKKQLAQLRYLYLYALAGRVFKVSLQPGTERAEYAVREELIRAAARFTNREFVLPARRFIDDCKNVVNYICAVTGGGGKVFRTTATGKNGTEIHSFDYVRFDRTVDLRGFADNKTFLGGTLRTVEFNYHLKQPWAMRLIFNDGFVRVVVG